MTTWRKELENAAFNRGEHFNLLVTTLTAEQLDYKFEPSYGGTKAPSFVAWGPGWVYFSVAYDGYEWVDSVPRNPLDNYRADHIGE